MVLQSDRVRLLRGARPLDSSCLHRTLFVLWHILRVHDVLWVAFIFWAAFFMLFIATSKTDSSLAARGEV